MATYKVLAPLVQLKVPDGAGSMVFSHFYAGAVLPESVDKDDLKRHVDEGLVVEDDEPVAVVFAVPAGTPLPAQPPNVPVTENGSTAQPVPPLSDDQLKAAKATAVKSAAPKSQQK